MGIVDKALELLFPSDIYCICCGNLINSGKRYSLCDECLSEIVWADGHTCEKCGIVLENKEIKLCPTCMEKSHEFDRAFTCMLYDYRVREMLHDYKFHGKAYMAEALSDILVDKFSVSGVAADLVVPVPIHPKKLSERGYNQAGLLAKYFAKKIDIDFAEDILVRTRYKAAMNKLGANERKENIIGSYALTGNDYKVKALKGKSVLLIDDIYTTGATADECSRILKNGGALEVNVLTLAAGAAATFMDV